MGDKWQLYPNDYSKQVEGWIIWSVDLLTQVAHHNATTLWGTPQHRTTDYFAHPRVSNISSWYRRALTGKPGHTAPRLNVPRKWWCGEAIFCSSTLIAPTKHRTPTRYQPSSWFRWGNVWMYSFVFLRNKKNGSPSEHQRATFFTTTNDGRLTHT